jgi:Uncharacterized protein conserved in bacteria
VNCPVCDEVKMREVEKDGVLIDVCPSCKGVWLDRGELEKLMQGVREVRQEFNEWYYGGPQYRQAPPPPQQGYGYTGYPSYGHGHDYKYHKKYKKKKSVLDVLGDLFD